jgi:hypothetical protein
MTGTILNKRVYSVNRPWELTRGWVFGRERRELRKKRGKTRKRGGG